MRGHGRKRVADRYLAALETTTSPRGDDHDRSASATKSVQTTKTRATEASSPFDTPLREDTSPLSPDLFAGPSRAPRRDNDPQAEDLRQYRQRREGGSPWMSESPGRTSKRRTVDQRTKESSSSPSIIDFEQESSIGSASSTELSRSIPKRTRPRSTLNQVVEKGLEFIFDSTACAAPPPPPTTTTWRQRSTPINVKNPLHTCAVPSRDSTSDKEMERKTFAAWKQRGRTMRESAHPPPPPTTQLRPSIPPLSPTQSDLTGIATEVVTNRAYDVAMKRIHQINTGVQEAKQRLDRERGNRYSNKKEMKSLVSVSSNDESSVPRPPKGDRIRHGSGPLNDPNTMSIKSEQSMNSSVGVNIDERSPSLQMPVLHPPMQRKTYRMPPGSSDLCLSPPSIVRRGSSRSVDPQSPDPIFSAKSFSMLSPMKSPGSLDASFVSDDALFMEKSDNHTIAVPHLDHKTNTKPVDPPLTQLRQDHAQGSNSPGRRVMRRSQKALASDEPESIAAKSTENDNSQSSVAKAFLQAVARRRGNQKMTIVATAAATTTEKPSISTKLNSPVDRGRMSQDDQASVDVKSIRSIFESKDVTAPGGGTHDDNVDDDDTASVKSLKEIFEPPRKKDDQSTGSSISRLRAKFDAQPKTVPKGKFADNDSIAKRSFALFEESSRKKSAPLHQAAKSKQVHRQNDPPVEKRHESKSEDNMSDTSEHSPEPIFVGTIEDTNSKATSRCDELSDDTNRKDKDRGSGGLVSDRPVRLDPPPMWMGHREIVLSKRFQIGNTDTFHLRSSEGVASSSNRVHQSSHDRLNKQNIHSQSHGEVHVAQLTKTEPDINDRSTELYRADYEGIQHSDAPSSTDRAQDDGYLPEFTTSSLKGIDRSPKAASQSFDSSESSAYSDGVTLDASIMEVSVLTNPTELVSKGSRQRHTHGDSDESPRSTKKSRHMDHAEAAAKHSEASSSQPSISAVPLLSKLFKNFPQSDDYSTFESKQSKLKRAWSQSQYESKTDDNLIDEAFGYDALENSDDLGFGWDLHHVETLLSPSEYVTDWEPFEDSPTQKIKHKEKTTSDSAGVSRTSHSIHTELELEVDTAASTLEIENSMENERSTNAIRAEGSSVLADPPTPKSSRSSRTIKMKTDTKMARSMIPETTHVSASNENQSAVYTPTSTDDNLATRPRVVENNSLTKRFVARSRVDPSFKKEAAASTGPNNHSLSSLQRRQQLKQFGVVNSTTTSQDVEANRPASGNRGVSEQTEVKTSDDKGISPVQSYLKAWRRTLEESKKSPGNRPKPNRENAAKVTESTRILTQSLLYNHQELPTQKHSPKFIRQRSLHAEEKDLLNPTSNAKDSPRARDFEARSIRRLRMRQMIDLFESDRQDRPPGVRSDTNVPRADSNKKTGPKSHGRHAFYPATNPASVSERSFPTSDPGASQSWSGEKGSLRARAVKSILSQKTAKASKRPGPERAQPLVSRHYQRNNNSNQGTPSPRTPRTQLIKRFRERFPSDGFGDVAASSISGDKTPTRSNVSSIHDVSDHSDAYNIMPYLLPDFEAARPSSRRESSTASMSSAIRSDVPPTSLVSEIAGYASASVGSSGVHAKSVMGASGHPVYRPKYTALRNRLKSLRESRLRREHDKQEFMASPTGVIEAHPPSLLTGMRLARQGEG